MDADRRHLIAATALAAAAFAPFAHAQTALDKTVVGFPPCGSVDTVARLLADQLRGTYAPTVIVENKAGAGGRLARRP